MYRNISVCCGELYKENKKELSKRNTILGEIQEEMYYLSMGDISDNDFIKIQQKLRKKRKEKKNKHYSQDLAYAGQFTPRS